MACRNVIVSEKSCIGLGSTTNFAGGIRQQFSSEMNTVLSMGCVKGLVVVITNQSGIARGYFAAML
jgi:histidinol phosphatase-like enzyme